MINRIHALPITHFYNPIRIVRGWRLREEGRYFLSVEGLVGFRRGDRNDGNEGFEVSAASVAQDANNNNARDKRAWKRNGRTNVLKRREPGQQPEVQPRRIRRKKPLSLSLSLPPVLFSLHSSSCSLARTTLPRFHFCVPDAILPASSSSSVRWISFFIERNEEERDHLSGDRLKNSKVCEISKKIVEKIGNQREREKLSCSRLRLANKRETGMRKKRVNGNTPPHFAAAIFPSRGFFAWRGGRSPCNHD